MKNELNNFLPIAPFWRKAEQARRKTERAFCWGIALGCALTTAVAFAIILL